MYLYMGSQLYGWCTFTRQGWHCFKWCAKPVAALLDQGKACRAKAVLWYCRTRVIDHNQRSREWWATEGSAVKEVKGGLHCRNSHFESGGLHPRCHRISRKISEINIGLRDRLGHNRFTTTNRLWFDNILKAPETWIAAARPTQHNNTSNNNKGINHSN